MLIFNLQRLFTLRGIDKPYAFMVKNGFASSSASNLLRYYPVVFKIKTLERLCVLLNCTPNDIFEWRDDKNDLPEDHALNGLKREAVKNFSEMIKNLPLEKMKDVENFLDNLNK